MVPKMRARLTAPPTKMRFIGVRATMPPATKDAPAKVQ